jgi:UDP-N-acetylmuramate dehydrogenase
MTIHTDYSLEKFNTFAINVQAERFIEAMSVDDVQELCREKYSPLLILGGGSNMLFTGNFNGTVVKIGILGKEITQETDTEIILKVGAGESWHELVTYCVENHYAGIENLGLIPGTVGASPIQNIGAYGVELKDVFDSLEYVDRQTQEVTSLPAAECRFGYRDSIFKHELRGKAIITSVSLRLEKNDVALHTSYKDIETELAAMNVTKPTIRDVFEAVCTVRRRKLPDPAEIGNAGSFFKNPTITAAEFTALAAKYPEIPHYSQPNSDEKIPAAWLIQQCGWKGIRRGNVGVHPNQALVLVHYGGATGAEIIALAREIQASVLEKFSLHLEMEVNII